MYLAMIPAALTIISIAIFLGILGLTGIAAVIIGFAEWLAQN